MSQSRKEANIAALNAAKAAGGTIVAPSVKSPTVAAPSTSTVQKPYQAPSSTNAPSAVGNVTPVVVTSQDATKDLEDIQSQHKKIVDGINNQSITISNNKAVAEAQAKLKAEQDAQAKAQADKLAVDKQAAEAKAAALRMANEEDSEPDKNPVTKEVNYPGNNDWRTVTRADGTTEVVQKGFDGSYNPVGQDEIDLHQAKTLKAKEMDEYTQAAESVSKTINDIQNGIIPLNAGEMAQIQGLQHSFQQLIQQQELMNKGAVGSAQLRGFQKGAAEYDPFFQVNTIGSIISAGANKVADLNIKMASAVAELTSGFKEKNIKSVKAAWDVYNTMAEKRQTTLQDTIDDAQERITSEQKRIDDLRKEERENFEADRKYEMDATKIADDLATSAVQRAKLSAEAKKILMELPDADVKSFKNDPTRVGYYNALANASLGLPENQRKESTARLNAMMAAGDIEGAKELIIRTAFQGQTGSQKEDSIRRMQAIDSLQTVKDLLTEYAEENGDTNILSGSIQSVQQKLGLAGTPEAAKINLRITQALQVYRNAITGAAWGDQETAEYQKIFPNLSNTSKLNTEIIDGMVDALNDNQRITLGSYIGQGTYDALFDPKGEAMSLEELYDRHPEQRETIEQMILDNPDLAPDEIMQIIEQ